MPCNAEVVAIVQGRRFQCETGQIDWLNCISRDDAPNYPARDLFYESQFQQKQEGPWIFLRTSDPHVLGKMVLICVALASLRTGAIFPGDSPGSRRVRVHMCCALND